jgi:hypothetical protein
MAKKKTVKAAKKLPNKLGKKELHKIAHYAFFVGLAICFFASFFRHLIDVNDLMTTLVFLGLIVGLFNLTAKETTPFLVACIALMLAGIVNLSLVHWIGEWLRAVLSNIVVFVVPAAIIVGMKSIWHLASD